jgi:prepilin-type N-terminal cleavage/methylation domain-containing protein
VRRPSGFTILEIIVVLLLMGILAATLLGRSITTGNLDLNSATDALRNQLRYTQAEAIKLANTDDRVWGMNFTSDGYWMFRGKDTGNKVRLPGVDSDVVNLTAFNISVSSNFSTVFFDWIGKPYSAYTSEATNTPLSGLMNIRLTETGGQYREVTITPETGLVR